MREVRRRRPGLRPVPVLCWGVPISPHSVQAQGGLVVRVREAEQHGPGHWTPNPVQAPSRGLPSTERHLPCALSSDPAPGSHSRSLQHPRPSERHPQRCPPTFPGAASVDTAEQQGGRHGRHGHTRSRRHVGTDGEGALSRARSWRHSALTPRPRVRRHNGEEMRPCSKPRSCHLTRRPQATLTPHVCRFLHKKTEFIVKGGAESQAHPRASSPGGVYSGDDRGRLPSCI